MKYLRKYPILHLNVSSVTEIENLPKEMKIRVSRNLILFETCSVTGEFFLLFLLGTFEFQLYYIKIFSNLWPQIRKLLRKTFESKCVAARVNPSVRAPGASRGKYRCVQTKNKSVFHRLSSEWRYYHRELTQ